MIALCQFCLRIDRVPDHVVICGAMQWCVQIDRISAIAAKYVGKPMVSFPVLSSPLAAAAARSPLDLAGAYGVQPSLGADMFSAGDLLRSVSGGQLDVDKPMIVELAVAAMDELIQMARLDEPLWAAPGLVDGPTEALNEEEYGRMFPRGLGPKQYGLKSEASRDSAVVIMTHANLVEILMDVVRDHHSCEFLGDSIGFC